MITAFWFVCIFLSISICIFGITDTKQNTPVFTVSYGEISKKITGRSRKGVWTYWLYTQDVIINNETFTVNGADESWLKVHRESLIKEKQEEFNRRNGIPESNPFCTLSFICTMFSIYMFTYHLVF